MFSLSTRNYTPQHTLSKEVGEGSCLAWNVPEQDHLLGHLERAGDPETLGHHRALLT